MAKRIGIMLPYPYTEELFNRLGSPLIVQPKIEGDRIRAVIEDGEAVLVSSSNAVRVSLPHIQRELNESSFNTIELDGEAYIHGWKHSQIRSIVSRTRNLHPGCSQMKYYVYDIVSNYDQLSRLTSLTDRIGRDKWNHIVRVPFNMIYTLDGLQNIYNFWLRKGFEGIVLRELHAPYVRKKTVTMLKLKPRLSDSFKIVGVIEAKNKYGKLKGTFGAFNCVTNDGKEYFNVGSGPTQVQRDFIWKNKDKFVDKYVKIRFQNYTNLRAVPKMQSIDKAWLEEMKYCIS